MLQIGKRQELIIINKAKHGIYLGTDADTQEKVLLPNSEVTEDMEIGDKLEVYIYRDSEDRIISTRKMDVMELGDTAVLKVKEVTNIGAFLDWGLPKDLFLPFKQQTKTLKKDQSVLVALYLDKSSRLCATMNVYEYLSSDSPYKKDDKVHGVVYEIIDSFGAYVAVDNKYSAMIPKQELFSNLKVGDLIQARVTKVKEDGRLDLSLREKSFIAMDTDSLMIYRELLRAGGSLPLNDKSSPEDIYERFQLSKNAFKRAIGHLYKEKKIVLHKDGIEVVK